jgi:hypothetical protein
VTENGSEPAANAAAFCVELEKAFCQDKEEERGDIIMSWLPEIVVHWPKIDFLLPMCPLFKLVQAIEKRQNNNALSEIDALIGSEIWAVSTTSLHAFGVLPISGKDLVCASLFQTLNWFREVNGC